MLSSFDWIRSAMGVDGGLAKVVKPGDLVQHRNGKQWGRVLKVVPQHDGSAELQIEGICRPEVKWDDASIRWWPTYHMSDWAPCYGPVQGS
jgi:hypothetical protein